MTFIFEQHMMGGDRNFGYLLGDREAGEAYLIDPSYKPELLLSRAEAQGLQVKGVVNTHGHHDHTNGNTTVQKATGAPIHLYPDIPSELSIGSFPLQVIPTPGHSEDHIVLYQPTFHIALTGDHLFVGKIGGTSTRETAEQQYQSLQLLFEKMPPETTVWPGHDVGCRPSSILALEKVTNPFLLAPTFDDFYALKSSWASYKSTHGLI